MKFKKALKQLKEAYYNADKWNLRMRASESADMEASEWYVLVPCRNTLSDGLILVQQVYPDRYLVPTTDYLIDAEWDTEVILE